MEIFGAAILTEPGGRAGRRSITGFAADLHGLARFGENLPQNTAKLLILNAFPGSRRLRTVGLRKIAGTVVEFEVLLLQRRIHDLNLNFPI